VLRFVVTGLVLAACGGPSTDASAKYPAQPEGCPVKIFPETPPMSTDNIGTVNASCGMDISNDDCLRTLMDQACKLGADVVWGVADAPDTSGGKKHYSGRAAHTRGKS
jgi:hypothetical protein